MKITISPDFRLPVEAKYFVIAANHKTIWDAFIATSALPWNIYKKLSPIRYMTHDRYLIWLWQKIVMLPLGSFPAKKAVHKTGIELAEEFMDKGQSIFMFPEGKMIKKGVQPKARVGVALLSVHKNAYIIPIHINFKDKLLGIHKITIYIGKPFLAHNTLPDLQPSADQVLTHIYSLK
jgi:1-acyl-sn-glycerol-3-phosphate acyltransferase